MWKALSVIAAIFVAGAALLSYLNKTDVEVERRLLKDTDGFFKDAVTRLGEVKAQQERFIAKNTKMETRRDEAQEEERAEKAKLDAKTEEVKEANDRIKELEMEIADAKAKIAEFGNIEQLMALIDQLQTDLFAAKNQIAILKEQLAASETRAVATAEKIQDYKNLEFRQRNGQMVSINASITDVYNQWGFVVLGAGDSDGVVSRTKLDVKRGEDKIAELVVTNLEKNRSVCDIVPGSMEPGQIIRPGDQVSVNADSLPQPKAEADATTTTPVPAIPGLPGVPAIPAAPPADMDDPFSTLDAPTTPTTPPAEAPDADDPFKDL